MKKKILIIIMTLLALAILVAPAMAKGPFNAEAKNDNPNFVLDTATMGPFSIPILDLNLPSEVTNRWFGDHVKIIVKSAEEFYNPTEILYDETNSLVWLTENRGKWVKMTKEGYEAIFIHFDLIVPDIPDGGVYIWGSK